MKSNQYLSVIESQFLGRNTRSEIKGPCAAMYTDPSLSTATLKNWFNEFQHGLGAPITATIEDKVVKVCDLIVTS